MITPLRIGVHLRSPQQTVTKARDPRTDSWECTLPSTLHPPVLRDSPLFETISGGGCWTFLRRPHFGACFFLVRLDQRHRMRNWGCLALVVFSAATEKWAR